MNDEHDLLRQSVAELLEDHCPPEAVDDAVEAGWAPPVWEVLRRADLTLLSVPEAQGGTGGGLEEAGVVLRALGRFAAPVPAAETALLAGWLLADAGLGMPAGPLTAAAPTDLAVHRAGDGWRVAGRITRVPWASMADLLVLLVEDDEGPLVLAVDPSAAVIANARNLASEPRDDLILEDVVVAAEAGGRPSDAVSRDTFHLRGALGRSLLMAGAAERALELSVRYASERVQFGRPLARFQAVQQHLAEMAAEVAAVAVATESAARAAQHGEPGANLRIAAAKVQAGRSGSTVARLAHQVHGAIGFTHEHVLRLSTTRLWSWRDEFGDESSWADYIGRSALSTGANGLWPLVTATD